MSCSVTDAESAEVQAFAAGCVPLIARTLIEILVARGLAGAYENHTGVSHWCEKTTDIRSFTVSCHYPVPDLASGKVTGEGPEIWVIIAKIASFHLSLDTSEWGMAFDGAETSPTVEKILQSKMRGLRKKSEDSDEYSYDNAILNSPDLFALIAEFIELRKTEPRAKQVAD